MLGIPDWLLVLISIVSFFVIKAFTADDIPDEREIVIPEFCEGNYCKNTCDRINATTMKSGGVNNSNIDAVDPTNPENQFAADDCDPGNKLLLYNSQLCGGDGESACGSSDCCVPKTCENDILPFTVSDKLGYLTDKGIAGVLTVGDVDAVNSLYNTQSRAPLDSKCPYQQTVKLNTPCMGTVGIGMDCTRDATDDCCRPKTCSTDWSDTGDWQGGTDSGMGLECPSNSDFSQKNGSEACDTCGQDECCFQQSDFCIVPIGVIKSGNNTNINNVPLPVNMNQDGRFHEDNNPNLAKSLIIGTGGGDNDWQNIQNIYTGVTSQTGDEQYGIMCNDGYMYGKCDSTGDSVTQETCNAHDNNQRGCEGESGCSFVNGNRPRIDFSECEIGAEPAKNLIHVGDCVNTCTGDSDLSDGVHNFFTNGIVDQKYLWAKMDTDDNYPYSTPGTGTAKQCNNYGASGAISNYNYQCEGGGGYFSVSDLNNCFSTCADLRGDYGGGLSCPENKTYDGSAATQGQGTTYIDFNKDPTEGGCCIAKTCENFSGGTSIECQDHEKIADNIQAGQVASRDNCCVPKTCTDFMNDYNTSIGPDGQQTDPNTICTTGNFNAEHLLRSNYKFSDVGETEAQLLTLYRSGAAEYDINCCTTQTCAQYYTRTGGSEPTCPAGQAYVSSTIIPGSDPVDGNNNTCCVSTDPISCSPTSELQHATPDDLSSMGYSIDQTVTDFNAATRFSELSFGLESVLLGAGDTETNVWSTSETAPLDGITCSPTFTGTPTLECQTRADETGHYYLKGCSPVPVVAGTGGDGTGGDGTSSCDPIITDNDRLCGLPDGRFTAGIETNELVFTDGAVIHMNSLAGQLDKFQCNESTEMPCFQSCPTSFTPMSISGCHYKDKPYDDEHMFYSDRYFQLDSDLTDEQRAETQHSEGSDCETLYETGPRGGTGDTSTIGTELAAAKIEIMANDPSLDDVTVLTKMKGNVAHFTCRCDAQSGGNECEHTDREMRFKYVFNEDMDYYDGNNGHISNAAATGDPNSDSYLKEDILNDLETTICDDGYYPFRGEYFDYCKPCDNHYKENHPISGIATSFCDNGSLVTTDPLKVVPINSADNYGNVYTSYTDGAGFTSTSIRAGSASNNNSGPYGIAAPQRNDPTYDTSNDPYNPYYDLSPEAADFTFGTRQLMQGSQVIEILDFGAIAAAAVGRDQEYHASPLSNAVQWWEEYLQSFSITRAGTGAVALTLQDITRDDLINQDRLLVNGEGILNVCNSNPNRSREYIPSFPTNRLTGTCEECNNNINNIGNINEQLKYPTTAFQRGDTNIIRNIDNNVAIPICSAEANIFNDSYNQGNIIDFRRFDGSPCGDLLDDNGGELPNCCVTGFQYINVTTDINKCFPNPATLVNDCNVVTDEAECPKHMQSIATSQGRLGFADALRGPEMTLCEWSVGAGGAGVCGVTNHHPATRIQVPGPGEDMYIDGVNEITVTDQREFKYTTECSDHPDLQFTVLSDWSGLGVHDMADRQRAADEWTDFSAGRTFWNPNFWVPQNAHMAPRVFQDAAAAADHNGLIVPSPITQDWFRCDSTFTSLVSTEGVTEDDTEDVRKQLTVGYAGMGIPTRINPLGTRMENPDNIIFTSSNRHHLLDQSFNNSSTMFVDLDVLPLEDAGSCMTTCLQDDECDLIKWYGSRETEMATLDASAATIWRNRIAAQDWGTSTAGGACNTYKLIDTLIGLGHDDGRLAVFDSDPQGEDFPVKDPQDIMIVTMSEEDESKATDTVHTIAGRTWDVGGIYFKQNGVDFTREENTHPENVKLFPRLAADPTAWPEYWFGQPLVAGCVDTPEACRIPGATERRPYWKKIGKNADPDLFLFFAHSGVNSDDGRGNAAWLISTKLTLMPEGAWGNNTAIYLDDGHMIAYALGYNDGSPPASGWRTWLNMPDGHTDDSRTFTFTPHTIGKPVERIPLEERQRRERDATALGGGLEFHRWLSKFGLITEKGTKEGNKIIMRNIMGTPTITEEDVTACGDYASSFKVQNVRWSQGGQCPEQDASSNQYISQSFIPYSDGRAGAGSTIRSLAQPETWISMNKITDG